MFDKFKSLFSDQKQEVDPNPAIVITIFTTPIRDIQLGLNASLVVDSVIGYVVANGIKVTLFVDQNKLHLFVNEKEEIYESNFDFTDFQLNAFINAFIKYRDFPRLIAMLIRKEIYIKQN